MLTVPVDHRPPVGLRLGCMIPKRHARRAVTRNALRRQVRAAVCRHATRLGGGDWLVRLRAPFAPARFPSARSTELLCTVQAELEDLLARACSGAHPGRPLRVTP